ncbi:MAG: hypothetical protein JWO03_1569 [Bacteroidetes bacterium]|nr:hypothetical protein [Bacteroidota bacterium]
MVTIVYKGKIRKIKEAVASANILLHDESFYAEIKAKEQFDMADIPASLIADLIKNADLELRLLTYIGSPRVHGYDDRDNPDLIHVNIFRSEWTLSSIVNTIVHQIVHAINDLHLEFNFSHGDQSIEGKENTAPFWIGNHAEERTENSQSMRRGMIHDAHPETLALDTLD